ncbi:MAG: triacylglycerol lipase [Deltaproteobacteria bacterium]|nr:triacylglycerol lipase [Deltaproteobacteria bacterium]MCB9789056.1 triacylglycerol lipase [Deltaproteobacteria bacterium]
MSTTPHQVYLIPGFFGFANLGTLRYFTHVREFLGPLFVQRGLEVIVHDVPTRPTASIIERARRLGEIIAECDAGGGPIHLIGHSTGGLDARLFTTPDADIGAPAEVQALASRVRSIVTIATPHFGAPLAASFVGFAGDKVLRLLSLATVDLVRNRRMSFAAMQGFVRVLNRLDSAAGVAEGLFDQIEAELLDDFSSERRAALAAFFDDVGRDRSLIRQLTPEGTELLRSMLRDRPDIRRASVVTRGRRPGLWDAAELGLDAPGQVLHAVYRWLERRAGFEPGEPLPRGADGPETGALLARLFGELPPPTANDGIVPTRSQPWGEVIHAAWADHLDVIGHFRGPSHDPPHVDWLPSGSRFTRQGFESLWTDVADFIAA